MYLIGNQFKKKPLRAVILPYLHERKVYLNKMKSNCKYFYTSFDNSFRKLGAEQ